MGWGTAGGPGPFLGPPRHATSYRLTGPGRTTTRRGFVAGGSDPTARCLRPAQAFLGRHPGHPVGRAHGDGPGLDLLLAEEPALAGGEARQGDRQRQQVEELAILLMKIGG